MKNMKWILALALTITFASLAAGPAAAQKKENPRNPQMQNQQTIRIGSIEARVRHVATGEVTNYQIEPGVTIPLAVGDQVAIRLRGKGPNLNKAMDLHADWVQSRGSWRLDVVNSATDFIEVKAVSSNQDNRGKAGMLSQIQYTLHPQFEARPVLKRGYLTFDIGDGAAGGGNPVDSGAEGSTARKVTSSLYYGVLGRAPSAVELDRYSVRLQSEGVAAVRTVARDIAGAYYPARNGDRTANRRVVGDLYRTLLGRTAPDEELWSRDPGFRDNVGLFTRRGMAAVVDLIVQSEEFANYQGLDNLRQETSRRGVRPRYR
ncbi:MAG: hypothetical protein AAF481_03265 [Acidobacteriota bacterium]